MPTYWRVIIALSLLTIAEFGVRWRADHDSRFRVVGGSVRNLRELARIRLRS